MADQEQQRKVCAALNATAVDLTSMVDLLTDESLREKLWYILGLCDAMISYMEHSEEES